MTTAHGWPRHLSAAGALVMTLLCLTSLAEAGGAAAPLAQHPSQLGPLTATSTFPRFTPAELAAAGFPDNLHACRLPSWQPLMDRAGLTYGPYSLARGTGILPRAGLVIAPGSIAYRGVRIVHPTDLAAPVVLPMVELLDWARRDLPPLLGHDRVDTLRVRDPGSLDAYTAETGQGHWRLHAWRGDECVIEPAATLAARTLDAHAAFAIVAEWLLDGAAGGTAAFPAWFRAGLGSYLAQYGVHLVNYVAEFRAAGQPVVLAAAATDSLLAARPDADPQADRRLYRTASYLASASRPSPTGYLHVGGARTALFNWLSRGSRAASSSSASRTPTASARPTR
jgi:hypothetical protein